MRETDTRRSAALDWLLARRQHRPRSAGSGPGAIAAETLCGTVELERDVARPAAGRVRQLAPD